MSEKEKGTNNSRFREIISVLRKHNITRGLSPKKLRLIMEDLGPTFVKIGRSWHSILTFFQRPIVMN